MPKKRNRRGVWSKPVPAKQAIQLKITLLDIHPAIWRQVILPDNLTLGDLHKVIQTVMGWHNGHMHRFEIHGVSYTSEPEPLCAEDDLGMENENAVWLSQIVIGPELQFLYEYDFGDSWLHNLTIEKIIPSGAAHPHPVCLAGKRACPPEDCGSYPGYEYLLKALKAKRKTTEQKDLLEWLGEDYDPEHFDLKAVNRKLTE